ncbi:MAG: hypothetical protein E6356_14040 [Terrisporobacter othiniensis]|nr:hypothetical protein [Terrisporobacter othiniensis]
MILKTETLDNINIILSLKNETYLIELELLGSDNNVISKEVIERHMISKFKIEDAFERVEMILNALGKKEFAWEDLENMMCDCQEDGNEC